MQQRKFTMWCFVFFVPIFVMFASSQVMAASSTCRTVANASGEYITVTAVTDGGFPLNFQDNNADTQNYCGNATMDNYPCTVFRYRTVSNGFNANHLYATIPVCPDDQLKVLNYDYYPLCKPDSGNQFADTLTCNMKSIFIPDGGGSGTAPHDWFIAVYTPPGKTVELGMNNIVLAKSGSTTEFFACNSEGSDPHSVSYPSGILGPGCLKETACKPNPYAAATTNVCLPNVNGQVLKLDVVNKEIEAVYQCPTTDTGCKANICDPVVNTSCSVENNNCVKQTTYEVEAKFYDRSGTEIDGGQAFKVTDVGGTVEEAIGYFVVSDSCPTTTCISGLAGKTICITKPCP